MKRIAGVFLIMLMSASVWAQDYNTALGVRGGMFSGLSLKHFVSGTDAFEGAVATHYRGFLIMGMYQKHARAFDAPGLNWYYGGGAHTGFYEKRYTPWFSSSHSGSISTFGIVGAVGIEYKIDDIPVTIGADITPALNLIGHTGLWLGSGLTLRYTFN